MSPRFIARYSKIIKQILRIYGWTLEKKGIDEVLSVNKKRYPPEMGPNGIKPVTILDFLAKVRESKLQSSNIYLTVIFHFESRSVIDLSTFDAIAKMVEIWYQDFEVPLKKSLFSFSVFIKINKICDIAILKYVFNIIHMVWGTSLKFC